MARKPEYSEAVRKAKDLSVRKVKGQMSQVRKCETCQGGTRKVKNCPCGGKGKVNIKLV